MNTWKVGNGYLHSLKALPHKMLSNHKGERATLQSTPPPSSDPTRLDQLWDIWQHKAAPGMGWEPQPPHFTVLLPKTHNSHSRGQTPNTPNPRDVPLIVFWNAKVTEVKERRRNFSRLKEAELTHPLSATGGSERHPFLERALWGQSFPGVDGGITAVRDHVLVCRTRTRKCPELRNNIGGFLTNASEGKRHPGNFSVSWELFLKPGACADLEHIV